MSEQIADHEKDIITTRKTWRRFEAYILFGLSMGFLFGTLIHSVLGGALLAIAVGSLPVIRPDFDRPAAIHREKPCPERAGANELDVCRSEIVLPARYGSDAAFGSRQRVAALLDRANAQGSPAWIQIPKAPTDLERRTSSGSDTVH